MVPTNEFVRRVVVEPWPDGGIAIELEATAEERRALARRFDLLDLPTLRASGTLERAANGELRFSGDLAADVVQTCVISLEPVAMRILEPIERRYRRPAPDEATAAPEALIDPEAPEVEPLHGTSIDFGEVLAEELGLALDPYPRAGDAYERLPALGPDVSVGEDQPAASPFAVLGDLYDNSESAR